MAAYYKNLSNCYVLRDFKIRRMLFVKKKIYSGFTFGQQRCLAKPMNLARPLVDQNQVRMFQGGATKGIFKIYNFDRLQDC